jgi:hypothetical protein
MNQTKKEELSNGWLVGCDKEEEWIDEKKGYGYCSLNSVCLIAHDRRLYSGEPVRDPAEFAVRLGQEVGDLNEHLDKCLTGASRYESWVPARSEL